LRYNFKKLEKDEKPESKLRQTSNAPVSESKL